MSISTIKVFKLLQTIILVMNGLEIFMGNSVYIGVPYKYRSSSHFETHFGTYCLGNLKIVFGIIGHVFAPPPTIQPHHGLTRELNVPATMKRHLILRAIKCQKN